MTTTETKTRAQRTQEADALLLLALDQALNRSRQRITIDSNDVDAFTAYLLDAGVDDDALTDVLTDR